MGQVCACKGCGREADSHDRVHCNLHAPFGSKSLGAHHFSPRLRGEIKSEGRGTLVKIKIPGVFTLVDVTIDEDISFADGEFEYLAFEHVVFKGDLSFARAKFSKGALFIDCAFLGHRACFSYAEFGDPSAATNTAVKFLQCTFESDLVEFEETKVRFPTAVFRKVSFNKAMPDFSNAEFSGNKNGVFREVSFHHGVLFDGTRFACRPMRFQNCSVSDRIIFSDNEIEGEIHFEDVSLNDTTFIFRKPKWGGSGSAVVGFDRVHFPPFKTFFEDINCVPPPEDRDVLSTPVILFRYCHLKDVYFIRSHMLLFSFFMSTGYDEAQLVGGPWSSGREPIFHWMRCFRPRFLCLRMMRRNKVFEEGMYDRLTDDTRERYELQGLNSHREVAAIYRRLKTAFDHLKDFRGAGRLYFNEFEMKRLAYLKELSETKWVALWRKLSLAATAVVYSLYKVFAGYGERPGWSTIWFVVFLLLFSVGHLANGFHFGAPGSETIVHYHVQFSQEGWANLVSANFWYHFAWALVFSFGRILPSGFVKGMDSGISVAGDGLLDYLLLLSNTIVLWIMLGFIAVGLKRHFRRY